MAPLSYTSNLLPAGSVAEIRGRTLPFFAEVRRRLGWPVLGLDLHLDADLARELTGHPQLRRDLRHDLDRAGLVVVSINAFPLGRFQTGRVKERVYRPDWNDRERIDATNAIIALAPEFCPDRWITISTLPGSFRPFGPQRNDPVRIAQGLAESARQAAKTGCAAGRQIVLCLEPEPFCTFESAEDIAAFWRGPLAAQGENLAVCLDTCHLSALYADGPMAVATLTEAGAIPLKVQFSACIQASADRADRLHALAEKRFLHQTAICRQDGTLVRRVDLDALDPAALPADAESLRSHFHIPIHRPPADPALTSTVDESLATLTAALAAGAQHLAIETYTWSVLAHRDEDRIQGVAGELAWLKQRMPA